MIIGLVVLVLLFTGGEGLSTLTKNFVQTKEAVAEVVPDVERRNQIIRVIDTQLETSAAHQERFFALQRRLLDLDRRHDATMAEYEPILSELETLWASAKVRLLDTNFELREHFTAREWAQLYQDHLDRPGS